MLDEDKSGEIDVEMYGPALTYIRRRAELSEAPASLVDVRTGETAIQKGLAHRLEQLSIERQRRDRANARAERNSLRVPSAARAVFLMIDKDDRPRRKRPARCVRLTYARRGDGRGRRPLVRHRRDALPPVPAQRHSGQNG